MKVRFIGVPCMFPHYMGPVSPSLTRQVNAVELFTKVRFSLFDDDLGLRVLVRLTVGKLCNLWRHRN